jgi:2-polyprenyl-3-methyl-5-hydroxy-6-metoxy-1,4-benzoquinol methylase
MRVSDIRPDNVMGGQRTAMQADIDWLAARRGEFVAVGCPACGSVDADWLYEKYSMQHQRCRNCSTQYVNPRPPEQMLGAFYAQSANYRYWAKYIFPQSGEARRQQIFRPRAQMLARYMEKRGLKDGTLVEVGAAHGVFCDEMQQLGLFSRIIAIEPTPDLAEACRQLGLETIEQPYENVKLAGGVDVVANFEVLEHLYDPSRFLRWAHDLLRIGGILFLTCPNVAGFETGILGRESDTIDHEHLNLFTPDSLTLLAKRSGFSSIEISTPGRLDVEIVQRTLARDDRLRAAVGPVLERLLMHPDPEIGQRLQSLLADGKLASHMCLMAERAD